MEIDIIQNKIYEVRGRRVMLDFDLAALYRVETKNLNLSVKRNSKRFPDDFMFQLSEREWDGLRLQFATSNRGGRRYMPYAFTEQGVAMLSGLLNSDIAIEVNINIMRAFVAMRAYITSNATITAELSGIRTKLELLERNDELLALNDEENLRAFNDMSEDLRKDIDNLYLAIAELSVKPPQIEKPRNPIGYRTSSNNQ